MSAPMDAGAVALGLAVIGFGVMVLVAPLVPAVAVQPILALVLAASGTVGLLLNRGAKTSQKKRKEIR